MEEKTLRLLFHHIDTPALAARAARELLDGAEATNDDEEARVSRAPAIHPSSLSTCMRQAAMELNGVPRRSHRVPEAVRRAAMIGSALHVFYQSTLEKAAREGVFSFRREVSLSESGHPDVDKLVLSGRADGIIEFEEKKIILEIKSIGGTAFKTLKERPLEKHLLQASVYSHCYSAEGVWFLYISRETFAVTHRILRIPDSYWTTMHSRAKTILDWDLKEHFPPGTSNAYDCTMCSYKHACPDPIGQAVPKKEVWACAQQEA